MSAAAGTLALATLLATALVVGVFTSAGPLAHASAGAVPPSDSAGVGRRALIDDLRSQSPTRVAGEIDYFALGDSIASGHGLMDDETTCRRSPGRAYPFHVRDALLDRFDSVNFPPDHFLACSGATAARLVSPAPRHRWLADQVDDVLENLSSRPTLISLTIGIDDLGWNDPARAGAVLLYSDARFLRWVKKSANLVRKNTRRLIKPLLAERNVSIVLTEYPNPVNRQSRFFALLPDGRCGSRPNHTLDCYARTEIVVHALNKKLATLRRRGRVAVTSGLHDAFHGLDPAKQPQSRHESPHRQESPENSCGDAPPEASETWIQYPGQGNVNSVIHPQIRERLGITEPFGDCFHPNDSGAKAYGTAVNEAASTLVP